MDKFGWEPVYIAETENFGCQMIMNLMLQNVVLMILAKSLSVLKVLDGLQTLIIRKDMRISSFIKIIHQKLILILIILMQ